MSPARVQPRIAIQQSDPCRLAQRGSIFDQQPHGKLRSACAENSSWKRTSTTRTITADMPTARMAMMIGMAPVSPSASTRPGRRCSTIRRASGTYHR